MNSVVKDLGQITKEIIQSWVEQYKKEGDLYYCKKCSSEIKQTTVYISIHAKEFGPAHAGPGKVAKINYPYCPKCDGEIDYATACFHVSITRNQLILLDDVTPLLSLGNG